MIFSRMGSKSRIAHKIIEFFPRHDVYMEPFFGAGGMFFNKPKSKFNYLNDFDEDIYNLFRVVLDRRAELEEWLRRVPITDKQFKQWAAGKKEESDVLNAVRFLILNNFSAFGGNNTLYIHSCYQKGKILDNLEPVFDYLSDSYFLNCDFREFFKKCSYKHEIDRCFCYCDPPYLETGNNYKSGFSEQDSIDLFDTLEKSGVRFAMSEFDHPFIIEQAKKRGLNYSVIGERANLKATKRTEILVYNFEYQPGLFSEEF